jgi:hypothetical protein
VLPSGIVAVDERWRDSASRELMARRYLTSAERGTYEALNPRQQRLWLLSRIAAKDAVRHARWEAGHGPMFPAEITLVDDVPGTVVVRGGGADGWRVALAHAEWIGAAVVDDRATLAFTDDLTPGAAGADDARRIVITSPLVSVADPADPDRHLEADSAPDGRDQRKDHVLVRTDLP